VANNNHNHVGPSTQLYSNHIEAGIKKDHFIQN